MFLKLTENETQADVYLNPGHIVRFVPNPAGEGTLIYMSHDAAVAPPDQAQLIVVHETAEEVFRMISRHEKPASKPSGRGLI